MKFPPRLQASLAVVAQEEATIDFIVKDGFLAIAAREHMVERPRVLKAQAA